MIHVSCHQVIADFYALLVSHLSPFSSEVEAVRL